MYSVCWNVFFHSCLILQVGRKKSAAAFSKIPLSLLALVWLFGARIRRKLIPCINLSDFKSFEGACTIYFYLQKRFQEYITLTFQRNQAGAFRNLVAFGVQNKLRCSIWRLWLFQGKNKAKPALYWFFRCWADVQGQKEYFWKFCKKISKFVIQRLCRWQIKDSIIHWTK